jgi:hypothetical protein
VQGKFFLGGRLICEYLQDIETCTFVGHLS